MNRPDDVSSAAFQVWQDLQTAGFPVLMAYRYERAEDLLRARHYIAAALAVIDAALAEADKPAEAAE
jgi:hypothetical protein